ncbi:hypothetical protein MMC30_006763 [Trapelia coarctata]|nr:hypothetical protein [Trapelia coarctata]
MGEEHRIAQETSRAIYLGFLQERFQWTSLTDGTLRNHFGEEFGLTKRIDSLYNNTQKLEAVVRPYVDEWKSPDRLNLWAEKCAMLEKRSYTYLAFLQNLSGKMQATTKDLLGSDTLNDEAELSYFLPFLLHAIMFSYRQNLDVYNQIHPQLLLEDGVGTKCLLSTNSSPWINAAPKSVRSMTVLFLV